MSEEIAVLSKELAEVIANPSFATLDSSLRQGKHIGSENLELFALLVDYQTALEDFYRKYNVELVKAPENFFYLRPKSTTLIARSTMTEYDMLVGKTLCYLYLSPERLAQNSVFDFEEILSELVSLCDQKLLLKLINPRATGTDLDMDKVRDKVRPAVNRLAKIGMLTKVGDRNSQKYVINEAVFRFGSDVRSDDNEAMRQKLFESGEATTHKVIDEMESDDE